MSVDPRAIVDGPKSDQSISAGLFEVTPGKDGIAAFKTQQIADGKLCCVLGLCVPPKSSVRLHLGPRTQLHDLAAFLHCPIPGELALRLRPSLFRALPAGQFAESSRVACNLRCDTDSDSTTAHFGKADRPARAVREIREAEFTAANLNERKSYIAVPLHRVHGKVEMSVKNQRNVVHNPSSRYARGRRGPLQTRSNGI